MWRPDGEDASSGRYVYFRRASQEGNGREARDEWRTVRSAPRGCWTSINRLCAEVNRRILLIRNRPFNNVAENLYLLMSKRNGGNQLYFGQCRSSAGGHSQSDSQ